LEKFASLAVISGHTANLLMEWEKISTWWF